MPEGHELSASADIEHGDRPENWVTANKSTGIRYFNTRSSSADGRQIYPRTDDRAQLGALDLLTAVPHVSMVARQLIEA